MKRNIPSVLLASFMAAAAAYGAFGPSTAQADDACATKKFHYPAVENACKKGGRAAAKDVMKAALKKAKDAGKDYSCKTCHEDLKSFKLKSNAVEDLKPWISG